MSKTTIKSISSESHENPITMSASTLERLKALQHSLFSSAESAILRYAAVCLVLDSIEGKEEENKEAYDNLVKAFKDFEKTRLPKLPAKAA